MTGNRTPLFYGVIALLVVAVVVLGYQLYETERQDGVEISVDEGGIAIEPN
ncbi:hypothetical protein [Methylobrevis albus]|uniref:Uncharacterized protein n=1 Tax=Methylobrevis albus TaxID=2793297 RepID=A0A931I0S9_9HYPH|nr:hypothetical protein [Methylobrevis albus]MBH0238232.1 hypothetical protein [Methylobrevis albus]